MFRGIKKRALTLLVPVPTACGFDSFAVFVFYCISAYAGSVQRIGALSRRVAVCWQETGG